MRELTTFVDNILNIIKKDSQYQLEDIQDWEAYLEYLKSILMEFDIDYILSKVFLGRFFYQKLRISIKL